MFNVNGIKAVLIQNNRKDLDDFYDDQDKTEVDVVVCPYNVDQTVKFGTFTVPEATGYFILKNTVDVQEGDQLSIGGQTYSILGVHDNWVWNKIANYTVAVK